jgi:serine/threonine protein kinase
MKVDKIKAVFRERDLLQKINWSPFIVQLDYTLQDEENLYFVMQSVDGGSLNKIIMSSAKKKIPKEVF